MTLIVAFRCGGREKREGIVIASDPQITYDMRLSSRTRKVFPIFHEYEDQMIPLAIFAGSGDLYMIHKARKIIEKQLTDACSSTWSNTRPSFGQFENTIDNIEQELMNKIVSYRRLGLKVNLSFILGGVDLERKASLYSFDSRGLSHPIVDYMCIGSGFVTGGNLLMQQFFSPEIDVDKGTSLAGYVINQVSSIDTSVGRWEGESIFFDSLGISSLLESPEALNWYLNDVGKREKLIRKVWVTIDRIGPETFEEILKKTEEASS